jgi:MFS family permease
MKTVVRLLMPIVIAVVLGPLIAGLAVCLLAVVTNIFDAAGATPAADLVGMFVIYILFTYVGGAPIALLAGVLVSIWMIWRPPGLLVAVVAAIAAIGIFRLTAETEWLSSGAGATVRNNLWPTLRSPSLRPRSAGS